jgi:SAM-dependent methyltransferase
MLQHCLQLAALHKVSRNIELLPGAAETLLLRNEYYDVVYAANLLHHLANRNLFYASIYSSLKPGGLLCTWDPLTYNPVINVYRKMASRVRTPNEHPLDFIILNEMRNYFPEVQHREFWFFALSIFIKFYAIDRLDPNLVRYWRHVHKYGAGFSGLVMKMLHDMDRLPLTLPLLNRMAWSIAIVARKM